MKNAKKTAKPSPENDPEQTTEKTEQSNSPVDEPNARRKDGLCTPSQACRGLPSTQISPDAIKG